LIFPVFAVPVFVRPKSGLANFGGSGTIPHYISKGFYGSLRLRMQIYAIGGDLEETTPCKL
jgi:hypothetical protein